MATVLITGGTGLLGKAIGHALLQKGYRVVILTRDPGKSPVLPGLTYAGWDPGRQVLNENAIREADHIIHLAGASLAEKRWSRKRKKEILDSRVESSRLLVKSLEQIPNNVKTVVSTSAIGWYGPDGTCSPFTEDAPSSPDFLGMICKEWEASINPVSALDKRLVILRIGVVLSKEGGALKEFITPLRFGVAAILGNGNQMVSWIHIDDIANLFITAIENTGMQGVYNAVAPAPVTNRELVMELAKRRGRFFIPVRVPAFLLKLVLGGLSIEVLKSATVSPAKVIAAGFGFRYPDITAAISSFIIQENRSGPPST